MKKLLICGTVILMCIVTTACGGLLENKNSGILTCTKEETDSDGFKTTSNMEVTYKDDKVQKVKEKQVMEVDKNNIDFTYGILSTVAVGLNAVDGFDIEYTKKESSIESITNIDYSKINIDNLKEAFGESFEEDSYYLAKDVDINTFKEENLKDYNCD